MEPLPPTHYGPLPTTLQLHQAGIQTVAQLFVLGNDDKNQELLLNILRAYLTASFFLT